MMCQLVIGREFFPLYSILHIHLIKRPTVNSSHSNDIFGRYKMTNRSKCFLIVNAILLNKALGN